MALLFIGFDIYFPSLLCNTSLDTFGEEALFSCSRGEKKNIDVRVEHCEMDRISNVPFRVLLYLRRSFAHALFY